MNKKYFKVGISHKTDIWPTPQDLFDYLNMKYNFTLDPASTEENHKCNKYFTEEINGLDQSWEGEKVFINPPYSDLYTWLNKGKEELLKNGVFSLFLIPSRTDTKYFQDIIFPYASKIIFLRGRLKFGDQKYPAPFGSMIVIFDPDETTDLDNSKFLIWDFKSDLKNFKTEKGE